MAEERGNNGKDEVLPALYGHVYDLAERLPLVQVHCARADGVLRAHSQGSSVICEQADLTIIQCSCMNVLKIVPS